VVGLFLEHSQLRRGAEAAGLADDAEGARFVGSSVELLWVALAFGFVVRQWLI